MSKTAARTIVTPTHGRFLVEAPDTSPPHHLLVGFHGYGENAERHLEQLRQIPGASGWLLVAVQALNRFYDRNDETVACWMTRQDREAVIHDNLTYVNRVMNAVRGEHQTARLVFVGFSQGVAMAYRATVGGLTRPDGLVVLGGDLPPDVRQHPAGDFPPILIGRGARDTWYTEERLQLDTGHLASIGVASVESVVVDAGHEWNEEFRALAGQFLHTIARME